MSFICPKCDRPLTKENSWHYCKKISIDDLLKNKPADLVNVFDKLFAEVGSWKDVSASATKASIVFITTKTFLVVKVMKNELDLKFMLPKEVMNSPSIKSRRMEKRSSTTSGYGTKRTWIAMYSGLYGSRMS